jgi:hypothetical protein
MGPSLGFTDIIRNREIWKEIAIELGGEFKIILPPGNELEKHTLLIPFKKWNIEISISDSRPLKFSISFISHKDFQLTLSWEDFITRIQKHFGKPEIELGWEEFDKHYLIKSNEPEWVKEILTLEIQISFLKHNIYSLSYQSDLLASKGELMAVIQRNACDKEVMMELIDMVKMIIDKLDRLGIIEQ